MGGTSIGPCQRRRLTAPPDFELLQKIVDVVLDRRRTYLQLAGDVLVGSSLGDQGQNLLLTYRQRWIRDGWVAIAQQRGKLAEHRRRDAGRAAHPAAARIEDRIQDIVNRGVPGDKRGKARRRARPYGFLRIGDR